MNFRFVAFACFFYCASSNAGLFDFLFGAKRVEYKTMDCCVCLENYDDEYQVPCTLNCGHELCQDCLGYLKNPICPLCRAPISNDKFSWSISAGLLTTAMVIFFGGLHTDGSAFFSDLSVDPFFEPT